MSWGERIYELAAAAADPLLPLAGRFQPKLGRGVAGWRGAAQQLTDWARAERDASRPAIWVHAPSVGEALMAQAIIAEVRRARPELQIVFTHLSPSAERIRARVGADVATYLPLDRRAYVRTALAAIAPAAVVFVRTEVWPILSREAVAQGASAALVNAVLRGASGRASGAGRLLLGDAYRRLARVGAVSAQDAAAFVALGIPAARVSVTGDARFDQVWSRVAGAGNGAIATLLQAGDRPVVVAGSTWPADEERLIPAIAAAGMPRPLRLVVAPHEPTPAHLNAIEAKLEAHGIASRRLSRLAQAGDTDGAGWPETARTTAVVIDQMGVLAEAYRGADAAFVGGGFGKAGLHSVIEPAALGVPVLFGPALGNASEAEGLEAAGGGAAVADAASLRSRLERWLADEPTRATAGEAARQFVSSRLGGGLANARLVLDLLER